MNIAALAERLRETADRHHQYEKSHGKHHWADWYAPYLIARQSGKTPDEAAEEAGRYVEEKFGVQSP
jgi:hypothetical protein